MIAMLAALTVAALATGAAGTDTTFAVKSGTRLELSQFAGSITVRTWEKSAVRVVADHGSQVQIEIGNDWPTLSIQSAHARGLPSMVDYRLTVPKWMALELSGVNTEMSVEGAGGEIQIETVQGEATVTGGSKTVHVSSVDGAVRLADATGRIDCSSVNGGVAIERCKGPITASSVNGEIVLSAIDSDDVEGSTVNGPVRYDGTIRDQGSYRFSSHNGEVSVAVPERTNATVAVATFSGEFSADFPVQLTETRHGRRFTFALGNGGARIELESFQGGVRLRRPGNPEPRDGVEAKRDQKPGQKTKEATKTKAKGADQGEIKP